jgi:hypothetical protein
MAPATTIDDKKNVLPFPLLFKPCNDLNSAYKNYLSIKDGGC